MNYCGSYRPATVVTMSTESNTSESLQNQSKNPRVLRGGGLILILLGLIAIVFPLVAGISLSIVLGALLVIGSILHVAGAFSATGWKGAVAQGILAVIYLIAGIALLANPVLGLLTLTLLLVGYFIAEGIVLIYMGFRLRGERSWFWSVASGVLSLIVAGLIWISFPSSAAWAVGLLFGIDLVSTGIVMFFLGRGSEDVQEQQTTSAA